MLPKKNIVIILQARLSSKRYPKKIFHKFWGKKLLQVICERQSAKRCQEVIKSRGYDVNVKYLIATSDEKSDDEVYELAKKIKIDCYRGSLENVLKRYYDANLFLEMSNSAQSDVICRVTADNIALDYNFIADHIIWYITNNIDYGVTSKHYPEGLKCEIFSSTHLHTAYKKAKSSYEKEHVTPYIIKNFRTSFFKHREITNRKYLSLTLDTIEDLERIEKIIDSKKLKPHSNWIKFVTNT